MPTCSPETREDAITSTFFFLFPETKVGGSEDPSGSGRTVRRRNVLWRRTSSATIRAQASANRLLHCAFGVVAFEASTLEREAPLSAASNAASSFASGCSSAHVFATTG